jgi:hypothetical protein
VLYDNIYDTGAAAAPLNIIELRFFAAFTQQGVLASPAMGDFNPTFAFESGSHDHAAEAPWELAGAELACMLTQSLPRAACSCMLPKEIKQ